MWFLTSPRAKRISGPKKFRSSSKKDFFNTIGAKRPSGKTPNLVRRRSNRGPCSKQSNTQSAKMVGLLETVNRCGDAFHSRLQLEGQKLGVVARLVQVTAMAAAVSRARGLIVTDTRQRESCKPDLRTSGSPGLVQGSSRVRGFGSRANRHAAASKLSFAVSQVRRRLRSATVVFRFSLRAPSDLARIEYSGSALSKTRTRSSSVQTSICRIRIVRSRSSIMDLITAACFSAVSEWRRLFTGTPPKMTRFGTLDRLQVRFGHPSQDACQMWWLPIHLGKTRGVHSARSPRVKILPRIALRLNRPFQGKSAVRTLTPIGVQPPRPFHSLLNGTAAVPFIAERHSITRSSDESAERENESKSAEQHNDACDQNPCW